MVVVGRGDDIKVDVNVNVNGKTTKMKSNTDQYPTMVVLSARRVMTNLMVKLVYITLVNL